MNSQENVSEAVSSESEDEAFASALPTSVSKAIQLLRNNLLDIGKRNRLINTPLANRRAKHLKIIDELSDEIFQILVRSNRLMSFLPNPELKPEGEDDEPVYIPPDEDVGESGVAARHQDNKLQTELSREALQKRLLTLDRDSRTMEEEQGVNILYLAVGFLKWFESENSETERFAPLLLLPVDLKRDDARGRFKLQLRENDLEANLSLRAMLSSDFGLELPDLPDSEEWRPSDYFSLVERLISSHPKWCVEPDTMVLGFYSFAKFLMWRDLDPETWPEGSGFHGNDLAENILANGFESEGTDVESKENLDEKFPDPSDLVHILDADSSQTDVIHAAREGRNLVVQGPPGTGKSQTIANIIAGAVYDGKKVLFIAEKRAALDVVHDRLEKADLGPLCLELHSNKANKKQILAELKRTLDLGPPRNVQAAEYQAVAAQRDALNEISSLLHQVDEQTGETAYLIIGEICRLREIGAPIPEYELPEAATWNREEAEKRLGAISALANFTDEYGRESDHGWRGVNARLSPMDRERLAPKLADARGTLGTLISLVSAAADAVGMEESLRHRDLKTITARLDGLADMPINSPALLNSDVCTDSLERARALAELLTSYQKKRSSLLDRVSEAALELPWVDVRQTIAAHGNSFFRFLNGAYRSAVATLRSVQVDALPGSQEERLSQIDALLSIQKQYAELEDDAGFGAEAFGGLWSGVRTDTETISPALDWISAQIDVFGGIKNLRHIVEAYPDDLDARTRSLELLKKKRVWREEWSKLATLLQLDLEAAFDCERVEDLPLSSVCARLDTWIENLEALEDWRKLHAAAVEISELGLEAIRVRLAKGEMEPAAAENSYRYARAEAVWARLIEIIPQLQYLDGQERTSHVEDFSGRDDRLKSLSAQEIALKHYQSLPRGGAGQMGILRGEIGRRRGHMAVRKLLDKTGDAITTIKPVFLMSPLSVAQYLTPGGIDFDLIVIDEASQVRPEDALGAIVRGSQLVVVGDRQQLPPSSFFNRQIVSDGDADYEDDSDGTAAQVGDMESILTLCAARGMPGPTLRWHYRSRHPSLIKVSNHNFYEDKLICPPSPEEASAESGLRFVKVEGVYDRGGKRNNPIEAQTVLKAVLHHAQTRPDQSLGVVTFSVAQRDMIRNELELLRAEHPELDAYCKESNADPFFVKNLENVQGDERDVIFISVGYGRDASGYMSQSFGPVTSEGGERRLNVLFTRAKCRCEVFSSIDHNDIRTDASKHNGPRILKRFLKFAATGEMDVPQASGREMDSPFEEAVAAAVRKAGYSVDPQVGSAGFFIDLAIRDPETPGRYLLGIECDGARYHSSRWARERDRLRQIVLEDKGWTLHRIWSTDWFHKPEAEMQKLSAAIDRAQLQQSDNALRALHRKTETPIVERGLATEPVDQRPTTPYIEASFSINERRHSELHEVSLNILAAYVGAIVQREGPIHIEEVGRRLSRLWGYHRAGARIQAVVLKASKIAKRSGVIRQSPAGNEFFVTGMDDSIFQKVRDRSQVASTSLRKIEMLPPSEIDLAIMQSVEMNVSLEVGQCAVEVARMLGFKSTSADLRQLVELQVQTLCENGELILEGNGIKRPEIIGKI